MLTEGEGRALTALHGEQTVSELATNLDRSLSYTSELVKRLETTGLVKARRQGKTKQVRLSDAKALELLTDLIQQYSHIDWPAVDVQEIVRCLEEKAAVAVTDGRVERRSTAI